MQARGAFSRPGRSPDCALQHDVVPIAPCGETRSVGVGRAPELDRGRRCRRLARRPRSRACVRRSARRSPRPRRADRLRRDASSPVPGPGSWRRPAGHGRCAERRCDTARRAAPDRRRASRRSEFATSSTIVRHGPSRSQRRPEVTMRWRQAQRCARGALETARERDVFHQRLVGIAADRLEQRALDEDALVAGRDAASAASARSSCTRRAQACGTRRRSQRRIVPSAVPMRAISSTIAVDAAVGQPRIGVQEQQHVATRRVARRRSSVSRVREAREGTVGERRARARGSRPCFRRRRR